MKIRNARYLHFLILLFFCYWPHKIMFSSTTLQTNRRRHQGYRRKKPPFHPSYGHICKRINKLNVHIDNSKTDDDDDDLIIAVDNTGIKITNRGHSGCMTNEAIKRRRGRRKVISKYMLLL